MTTQLNTQQATRKFGKKISVIHSITYQHVVERPLTIVYKPRFKDMI